jgi:RHS repeat-associated protein
MKLTNLICAFVLAATATTFANASAPKKMNGKLEIVEANPADVFYTGKPYEEDLGGYVFNYRTYSPEINRWTTPDPSGFPDGANNHLYASAPTTQIDPLGLTLNIASPPTGATYYRAIAADIFAWNSGYDFAGTLQTAAMNHAESGKNWTLNDAEIAAVRSTSTYSSFRLDVQGLANVFFTDLDEGSYSYSTGPTNYTFPHGSDAYYAFGDARLATSGTGVVDRSGGIESTTTWTYNATVTLSDVFTFAGYGGVPWYTPTGVGRVCKSISLEVHLRKM